ncbi:MAG: hypothetical protein DI605_13600 [Sphingomonas sp.]|nr:MAG: hypothetical protein DI605_13600 [Sphingomonas sp.]
MLKFLASSVGVSFLPGVAIAAARPSASRSIDWATFLGRHDMIWDQLPRAWDEAPFLGNGLLGALLFYSEDEGGWRLEVSRTDVQDHRTPIRQTGVGRGRLPIGHFLLRTRGKARATALRLVLHDALLTGRIVTDTGQIDLRVYVHAEDLAIVVETKARGGESGIVWEWVGEDAVSPRITWAITMHDPRAMDAGYQPNPAGERGRDGAEEMWLQPLLAGGGTATAWRQSGDRLIASVAHQWPGDLPRAQALASVRSAADDPSLERRHREWWHGYYPASFLSIPDGRIESFYWIQMYKLACATRADRPYIDNQGPWLQVSTWPYATWNLNVQLNYWAPLASNRAHLAYSLVSAIHDHQQNLIDNVDPAYRADSAGIGRSSGRDLDASVPALRPDGKTGAGRRESDWPTEFGNLTWAMHDVWLIWRHTMDEAVLRETLFPVLRRAINHYRHFLMAGSDGKLHLPPTYSPEYGAARDLNYDLALLRWGCGSLIDAAGRLKIDDPLLPDWRRILRDLVDFPRGETGFLIGAGLPLEKSHRHYSHLLMVYPLYLVNRDQPGGEAVIRRSLDHWQSMKESLRGYSSTGAASMHAALGDGDEALTKLRELFSDYMRSNTLYKEGGPVIETPLSGAQSLHDMMLQSWGGTIRVFPAVPGAWADCVFADFSAEGGFLVSAQRKGGRTRWIEVTSRAGEPFALKTGIIEPVATVDGMPRALSTDGGGRITCALERGETIVIEPKGARRPHRIGPVPVDVVNSFGLNARSLAMPARDLRLYKG